MSVDKVDQELTKLKAKWSKFLVQIEDTITLVKEL